MNDPLPHELVQEAPAGTYLVDAYEDWAKAEGAPVHTGVSIDMLTAGVGAWPRFGAKGAFCHTDGRCDFLSVFLLELEPGKSAAPQRHLYEEVCYVLSGTGETEIETASGKLTIPWGARSLFSMPMNARYRHSNTGSAVARIAGINDMRYLYNLFRNEEFVFNMPLSFPERDVGEAGLCAGVVGPRLEARSLFDLEHLDMAGAAKIDNGSRLPITLFEGSIAADVYHLEAGIRSDAKRQFQGVNLIGVSGEGDTLVTQDGRNGGQRTKWRHGVLFSAPAMSFYQHVNTGKVPARFLTVEMGSIRYPMFRHRRADYGDSAVYAAGRSTIPARESGRG